MLYIKLIQVIQVIQVFNQQTSISESNYIVDVVMWPKFGNHSISMREVIISSILWGFDDERSYHNLNFMRIWPEKNNFSKGYSWLKFNNFGLAISMTSKIYTSVTKWLKLTVGKFWGLNPKFVEVTEEKPLGGLFSHHPEYGLKT